MNKKKLVTMLVSLSLVAALGVGATLALFTDKTNTLTNTFVVGNGIEVTIAENVPNTDTPDANDTMEVTEVGYDYNGYTLGTTQAKEPFLRVEKDSADCYLLMKVTGVDDLEGLKIGTKDSFLVNDFSEADKDGNKWVKTTDEPGKDGIYILVDSNENPYIVEQDAENGYTSPFLFKSVTLQDVDVTSDEYEKFQDELDKKDANDKLIHNITLVGCAIQADNAPNTIEGLKDKAVFE